MYDILLQNNSSKEVFLLSKLWPSELSTYFITFQNLRMPSGVTSGEYTYALIYNNRRDVTYTFNSVFLETTADVVATGKSYTLEQLNPITGLLRIVMEDEKQTLVFPVDDVTNNNTVYYYEG